MRKYAALFPGQGSQYKQMCKALIESDTQVRRILNEASLIVGWDMKDKILNGDIKTLTHSNIAQPTIVVISYCLFNALVKKYGKPELLVGHSLGEVSASLAAGAITFEDCIHFVKMRSTLMEDIRKENVGFAGVILDLEEEQVKHVLLETNLNEACFICAYNAPKQFMVGGLKSHEKMLDKCIFESGGQYVPYRMIPMRANVAYHSILMKPFAKAFANLLEDIEFNDPDYPIYSTVESKWVDKGATLKQLLQRQLLSPVLWSQAINYLSHLKLDDVIEVGPGDTMCNLVKEHNMKQRVWSYDEKKQRLI